LATNIIMPALEMAQDKGKLVRWLKPAGATVTKGEPIMEIETDKVTVEIEASASGTLGNITAREGDVIPVGQTIALILEAGESAQSSLSGAQAKSKEAVNVSPVARRIAEEHGVDLAIIKPSGGKIEKADVLAFVNRPSSQPSPSKGEGAILASPKAKRLAQERGVEWATLRGTGPDGAVIAKDIPSPSIAPVHGSAQGASVSTTWRVMAERMSQSWTTAPHFYLVREVNASRLQTWRESVNKRAKEKITITDLLVKVVGVALRQHSRVNVSWNGGAIVEHPEVNIGLAIAIDGGLIVPVVHRADTLNVAQITARRQDIVARAQSGRLKLDDLQGGTFTISNLGMFGVDAFHAIVNPPQAAILAVGRIADRVVAIGGQPAVQPMMTLTLSFDHRAVDGARGAQFLGTLADLIEEPLTLLG